MVQLKKNQIASITAYLLSILDLLLIPQAINIGIISIYEGIAITVIVSIAVSFIMVYSNKNISSRKTRAKFFAIFASIIFTFLASIIMVMSVNKPLVRVAFLAPVTILIFLPMLYLYHKMSQPAPTIGLEYSPEYTERLAKLLGLDKKPDHDVWISSNPRMRAYADASLGRDWRLFVNGRNFSDLTSEQQDIAMLTSYFSRETNSSFRLVVKASILVALYVDLLLSGTIIQFFSALIIPSLAMVIVGFAGIVSFPFQLSYLLGRSHEKVDRMVLSKVRNSDEIGSYLRKSSQLLAPMRPMSQRSYQRYMTRLNKMTEKRISKLLKSEH